MTQEGNLTSSLLSLQPVDGTITDHLNAVVEIRLHASDKVLSKPILCLEDIALNSCLRKCVDVKQDDRKAASVRHLKRKLRIGANTLYDIVERLERANRRRKVLGLR
jgi:hypothetical protein